jgi:uncharacterized protein (DUF1778 family)
MPRIAVEDNSRMQLRIRAEEKALLWQAVALNHTDLTALVLRHALLAAKAVIQEADHVKLSGRDSLRVLALLEHPPAPNAKLLATAPALAKPSESLPHGTKSRSARNMIATRSIAAKKR